jgi:hypothetical protein
VDDVNMIGEFSKYGLLGVLFLIALYAIKVLAGLYRDTQEKRIEEHKVYSERLLVATNANTDATKVMTDGFKALARAVEDLNARSQPRGRR